MKASPVPNPKVENPKSLTRTKPIYGRAVAIEGIGKELYRVSLLELEDGKVVSSKVLELGREQMGATLPVAFGAVAAATSKYLREATDLWQRSQP